MTFPSNPIASRSPQPLLPALLLALPWLVLRPTVPDAVLYNQIAALAAWAAWLVWGAPRFAYAAVAAPLAALVLCAAAALGSGMAWQGGVLPVLAAAAVVLAAAAGAPDARRARPVAWGFWLAGVLSVAIGLVQLLAPEWADGVLVGASAVAGRAVGNLRQPNHLATALLCSMVMTAWLWQGRHLGARWALASLVAMVVALAATASRTGMVSLAVLVAWAALDRRLPRGARVALACTPLVYATAWGLIAVHAAYAHEAFYGSARLAADGDLSSSRFAIWRNAWALVLAQPWAGVGWGHFNAAWTFTPLPDRPVAFFDHAHNLPLHLAVEIGVPATLAVLGLLLWGLWRARAAWQAEADGAPARAALVLLALLALHSLLEYPLWYAYFLLPAAWALGVWCGAARARPAVARRLPSVAVAAAIVAGVAWTAWDHGRVEVIFAPSAGAVPLAERIAAGRHSVLFGHQADYAAVTTSPRERDIEGFARPLRQLVDTRLLIAYIEALHASGRTAEALYAAQRLREFRRPDAQAYFKACDEAAAPWFCDTRPVALTWRDLLP